MDYDKQPLLNIQINNFTMDETVSAIFEMIDSKRSGYVMPVNVDVMIKIDKDDELKEIADNADIVLVDGQPLVWISKFRKSPVKAKVSGSDLVPRICSEAAEKGYSVFLFGGKEEVSLNAKHNLERDYPGIKICGVYSPPLGFERDEVELEKIREMIVAASPNLVIACLGCPKQEKWVYRFYNSFDACVCICAGATIDFLAGNVKRAPAWMSNHGLEWLYRFCKEPKRLFRRYFIDDVQIVRLLFKYKNRSNK